MSEGDCVPFSHVAGRDAGSLARCGPGEPREWIIERVGESVFLFPFFFARSRSDVDWEHVRGHVADSLAGRSPGHPSHVSIFMYARFSFSPISSRGHVWIHCIINGFQRMPSPASRVGM